MSKTVAAVKTDAVAREGQPVMMIMRTAIRPDPDQPRKVFNQESLEQLASSIKDQGIIQPLIVEYTPEKYTIHEPDLTNTKWTVLDAGGKVVFECGHENGCRLWAGGEENLKPYYKLVAGERRWRASELAELDLVPCIVRQPLEPKDRFVIQHAENNDREGLTPMDEAESFHKAVYVDKLFTVATLAAELGRKPSHVYARIALAKLPMKVKEAVAKGELNAALAELVAKIPGEKLQLKAMKEILEGGVYDDDPERTSAKLPMSVRKAKAHIEENYTFNLERAPFNIKDDTLLPAAGACAKCPHRSENCRDAFPDIKGKNVCTNPLCYQDKAKAHLERSEAKARERGLEVLSTRETKGLFIGDTNELANWQLSGRGLIESLDVGIQAKSAKGRTAKQILGKDAPKPVAAISPTGGIHELFRRSEVEAALKAKGVTKDTSDEEDENELQSHTQSPEEARQRRQEMLRQEAQRKAVGMELVATMEKPLKSEKAEQAFWCRFLNLMLARLSDAGWEWEMPFRRRGIEADVDSCSKLPVETLRAIAGEVFLVEPDDGSFTNDIALQAKIWGVDVKAVEKQAGKEFDEANRMPRDGEKFKVPREWLDGRVAESNSVETMMKGTIRQPFEWRGHLWIEDGSCSSGEEGTIWRKIWRVVNRDWFKAQFKEPIMTREEKLAYWDKNEKARGDMHGTAVKCGQLEYVLCEPCVELLPDKPLEKKGKKK